MKNLIYHPVTKLEVSVHNILRYTQEEFDKLKFVCIKGISHSVGLYIDDNDTYRYDGTDRHSAMSYDTYEINKLMLQFGLNKEQMDKMQSAIGTKALWSFRDGQVNGSLHERGINNGSRLIAYC